MKRVFLGVLAIFIVAILLAPTEPAPLSPSQDYSNIQADVDAYLKQQEANVPNLKPEVAKQVLWADIVGQKSEVSIVYLHGYSATKQEISPVIEEVAKKHAANVFFTRLTGHGRDGDAMAEATVQDWINDTAQAIEIGRKIGNRVVVVSTSTGGTLAAAAALDATMSKNLAGVVFISPNFQIATPVARILTWPWVRYWGPIVAGAELSFEPQNEDHAYYWTTRYPTVSTVPMAALVKAVVSQDFTKVKTPALFMYSRQDQVVNPEKTDQVFSLWGGKKARKLVSVNQQDNSNSHVIAGDIISPSQNAMAISEISNWITQLQE